MTSVGHDFVAIVVHHFQVSVRSFDHGHISGYRRAADDSFRGCKQCPMSQWITEHCAIANHFEVLD